MSTQNWLCPSAEKSEYTQHSSSALAGWEASLCTSINNLLQSVIRKIVRWRTKTRGVITVTNRSPAELDFVATTCGNATSYCIIIFMERPNLGSHDRRPRLRRLSIFQVCHTMTFLDSRLRRATKSGIINSFRLFWVGIILWCERGVFLWSLLGCRWPDKSLKVSGRVIISLPSCS